MWTSVEVWSPNLIATTTTLPLFRGECMWCDVGTELSVWKPWSPADPDGTRLDLHFQLGDRFGRNLATLTRASIVGGYGSGGRNKRHDHLEGRRRISVSNLRRHGLMRTGALSSFSWTDNWKRPTGSIQIVGGPDFVTLVYSVRSGDAEAWRHIEDQVAFARVPKSFGGEQIYMFCPKCGRRALELALGQERFRCRICLRLVHGSSQQSPTDRAMRRANKLKLRLGAEPGLDSFYGRPKHMRLRTFERIDARIRSAEAEVNDAHILLLGRLGRLDRRMSGRHASRGGFGRARAFW